MDPRAYQEIAEVENRHWWFLGRRRILAAILDGMTLPAGAAIFEIGAGTGGNLAMLARHGSVRAAEMDETARAVARAQTGGRVEIEYGMCPHDIPFAGVPFDLICMFDVLEHVEEDAETLAALKERLAPGGRLLVTVPAYRWMWGPHDAFLHHKRRYARAELGDKLRAAGYRVTRLTHFNTLLFPLAAAVRLKDRLIGGSVENVNALPAAPVNAALTAVFSAERHLVPSFDLPFGVSLLAIAEPLRAPSR